MANDQEDGVENQTELIAVGELAKRLRVSVRQVHRMNKAGLIPAPLRIGGCTRWRAAEVAAWLRAGSPPRREWEKRDTERAPTVEDATCER
jgi:excisionase family DNA binding protein